MLTHDSKSDLPLRHFNAQDSGIIKKGLNLPKPRSIFVLCVNEYRCLYFILEKRSYFLLSFEGSSDFVLMLGLFAGCGDLFLGMTTINSHVE